jgi:hypothetical protein
VSKVSKCLFGPVPCLSISNAVFDYRLKCLKYPCLSWGALCPFGWFGLVGLAFNASLEPQPRARRGGRLAEDAPARNAFWTGRARLNPGTACTV